MNIDQIKHFVGLGKVLFNSSVCRISVDGDDTEKEIFLTERLTRKKASGAWPEKCIMEVDQIVDRKSSLFAENRDVITPARKEILLNSIIPFFEHLKQKKLEDYSSHFNNEIEFVTHHFCHAMSASMVSPFDRSIIVVMDGAGSNYEDFSKRFEFKPEIPNSHEECTVFLQDGINLKCVLKNWQFFKKSRRHAKHDFSEGAGTFYEKAAEYIFNCKRASGKVMGLAAFGVADSINVREEFLENLDWRNGFAGKGKIEWENTGMFEHFSNVAATVQMNFEKTFFNLITTLKKRFPDYNNLIFTGGCALNCTSNMKMYETGLYDEIYIPPFPGDEGISFGLAGYLYHIKGEYDWNSVPHENQHGYFGPITSFPDDKKVERIFQGFEILKPQSIIDHTCDLLEGGDIIGWFQGRSESGPRALGNRSILARIDKKGLKDYLNDKIKFRETFRPYGCSCIHQKASEYFEVPDGFNNPYMSFSPKVRTSFVELLKEVTHFDGTSRMQTVRKGQNEIFYNLLYEYGKRTGLFCLLNTSLNVMGEPIVETVEDARNFLKTTNVDGIVVGNYFIKNRKKM